MSGSKPRLAIVLNPAAAGGQGASRVAPALDALSGAGVKFEVFPTTAPGHARALARELALRAFPVVVAAGGDGAVNEVGAGLMEARTDAALGVLPLGTGNDFAASQGIRHLPSAVEALRHGRRRTIDVIRFSSSASGVASTHYALLFVGAGFAGDLLRHTTPKLKRIFGRRWSYPLGFLRAWLGVRSHAMTLKHDEGEESGRFLLVVAANSEFVGGQSLRPAPGARMDDGVIDLLIVRNVGRWAMLPQFLKVMKGTHGGHPSVRLCRTRRLRVESPHPVGIQADGDLFGSGPLDLEVLPGALSVISGAL